MNNVIFLKTMENVRTHRDIKLSATKTKASYSMSQPNYHMAKSFFR